MKLFSQHTQPVIIAHRGASASAPENTLAAFNKAVENKADGVEFDVKLTSDREVVVMHDRSVDRTTDGTGNVNKLSFREVRDLDAGVKFSADYKGERIPSLRDVCQALKGRILLNIELTNYGTGLDSLPQQVAEIISDYKMMDQTLISSFNPFNLVRYHKYSPETELALLIEPKLRSGIFSLVFGRNFSITSLHPHYTQLNETSMNRYQKRFSRINSWTINSLKDIKAALKLGVNGIITDYPERARCLIVPGSSTN